MYVTTLGTSHGDQMLNRFNSSTLYETGDNLYIFDAGEPVTASLVRKRKDFSKIKAIFITHMHSDHVAGLPLLLCRITRYPVKGQHTDVYLSGDRIEELTSWLKAMQKEIDPELITFHVVKEGFFYDDGVMKVKAIPTLHGAWANYGRNPFPSFAYHIEVEGKKILHTGDLKGDFSDFPKEAQTEKYDLCLCEATHYKPQTAMPILETAQLDRLLFVHILDCWDGCMGKAHLLKLCQNLPYPVGIAEDGNEYYF